MPSEAKRSSESDRAEVFCPKGIVRLPSPRLGDAKVMVEVDLASFAAIIEELKSPGPDAQMPTARIAAPGGQTYPNLRLMLTHQRYYSQEGAEAELRAVLDFVDGKR